MANQNQGSTSNRGFASMDENKQREIASQGGKAATKGQRTSSARKRST
jgi:general stress protein YciG